MSSERVSWILESSQCAVMGDGVDEDGLVNGGIATSTADTRLDGLGHYGRSIKQG
jgi:hypothetical protein